MVACFRIGAVALPCTEQLRPKDLRARMDLAEPRVVVADERDADAVRDAGFSGPLLTIPDESMYDAPPAPAADLSPDDPALITFTSGTAGEPKPIRHGQRYLPGQRVQAEHWFGARDGDLAWCTAASRLVEVGAQRLHRALAHGRHGAAARRPLRPRGAARRRRARGRERALHGAHRVPRGREARGAARAARAPPRRRRRRAAQPRDRPPLARRGRDRDPRRLRPDRDRRAHRDADRPARPARVDGPPPPRLQAVDRRGRAVRRPLDRAHVLPRRARTTSGAPATASARTRTATSGSRAAPTT